MMESLRKALRGVAKEISDWLAEDTVLGLGSGSTVAALLEELAPVAADRGAKLQGVPTSLQIEKVARRVGIRTVQFQGRVDLHVDGADQVDGKLNLVKGGGGALLKEKVLASNAARVVIVASEEKFARRLCESGMRVPVEVFSFAREAVKSRLAALGAAAEERLLEKGYPYFTENGNVMLDAAFQPLDDPGRVEADVKRIPGVVEVGIFTVKPITVYRLQGDGGYVALNG